MYKEPKDYKEVEGWVLCKKYTHSFVGELKAIPNKNIEGDYEILVINKETDDAFYGIPLEGMGLINCMALKSDCRPFTEEEWKYWMRERAFGMFGSNSGNLSYEYKINLFNDLMAKGDALNGTNL